MIMFKLSPASQIRARENAVALKAFPSSSLRVSSHASPRLSTHGLDITMKSKASPLIKISPRFATHIVHASAVEAVGDDIKVAKTDLTLTQRKLDVVVPASMVKECFNTTVERLRGVVGSLPGFRMDKIPLAMIVANVGGQRQFKIACIEEILLTCMPLVLNQVGEPLVNESERIVSQINDLEKTYDPAKPFAFEIEYETPPPIKWRQPFRQATVSLQDTGDFSTDVAATEDLIKGWRKEKGGFQRVVVGRGLQRGDTCIMDIDMKAEGSTVSLPGMKKQRFSFDTDMDPLGLVKGLEGVKPGEERKLKVTFPADYDIDLWRGMAADVTIKVHEVFNWELPKFDNEWVTAHFAGQFENVEDMKKNLLATTAMERVKDLDKQLEDKLLDVVVECLDMPEVPEKMVIDMGQSQYRNNLMGMLSKKMATKEDLEMLLTEELIEEYLAKNRKDIVDLVKFNLAVGAIFEQEGLTFDEADIQSEVEQQKQQYIQQELEFDPAMLKEQVMESFRHVRVIEHLKDVVPRTVVPYDSKKV